MSKSVPQLTEKTDSEDADLFHIVRSSVDYKTTKATLFDDLRFSNFANDYDAGTSYEVANPPSKRYAMYNNILWKFIGASPATGVTPGTDATKWEKTYCAELAHFVGEDTLLASGTADEVTAAEIRAYLDATQEVTLALSAADLKTLSTTVGIEIVAAPGAGFAIEVESASIKYNYVTTAFGAAISPSLKTDTAAYPQANCLVDFTATSSKFGRFQVLQDSSIQVVEDKALKVYSQYAATATGAGNAVIYLKYRIITL